MWFLLFLLLRPAPLEPLGRGGRLLILSGWITGAAIIGIGGGIGGIDRPSKVPLDADILRDFALDLPLVVGG